MRIMKYVPNILTVLRVILVPVYLLVLYLCEPGIGGVGALIIFILAGITDYLDGKIARKYGVISNFGKIADPLADKIIVTAALVTMALKPMKFISFYIIGIIVFREIGVTLLRSWYQKKGIIVAANNWGKIKTILQMVGIISALTFNACRYYIPVLKSYENSIIIAISIFFWIVALVTVVSGITYLPWSKNKNEE